jgi:hypothetical protein
LCVLCCTMYVTQSTALDIMLDLKMFHFCLIRFHSLLKFNNLTHFYIALIWTWNYNIFPKCNVWLDQLYCWILHLQPLSWKYMPILSLSTQPQKQNAKDIIGSLYLPLLLSL